MYEYFLILNYFLNRFLQVDSFQSNLTVSEITCTYEGNVQITGIIESIIY